MRRPHVARWAVLALSLVYVGAPIVAAVVVALSPHGMPSFAGPLAYPSRPTLGNFEEAVFRGRVALCFANSFALAMLSATVGTVVGFPAAYALSRTSSPWRALALASLLALRLHPKMPAISAQYHLASALGLLDSLLSVALLRGFGIAMAIWLMKAAIDSVPRNLEQAALLDGLRVSAIACRVIVPLAAPGIVAAFLLEFASAWNSFLLPLLLLSSEARMTIPLGIDRFLSGYAVEQGPLMAYTLLVSLPLVVLFPPLLARALTPLAQDEGASRRLVE